MSVRPRLRRRLESPLSLCGSKLRFDVTAVTGARRATHANSSENEGRPHRSRSIRLSCTDGRSGIDNGHAPRSRTRRIVLFGRVLLGARAAGLRPRAGAGGKGPLSGHTRGLGGCGSAYGRRFGQRCGMLCSFGRMFCVPGDRTMLEQ